MDQALTEWPRSAPIHITEPTSTRPADGAFGAIFRNASATQGGVVSDTDKNSPTYAGYRHFSNIVIR
jgi:hypothetical protein